MLFFEVLEKGFDLVLILPEVFAFVKVLLIQLICSQSGLLEFIDIVIGFWKTFEDFILDGLFLME